MAERQQTASPTPTPATSAAAPPTSSATATTSTPVPSSAPVSVPAPPPEQAAAQPGAPQIEVDAGTVPDNSDGDSAFESQLSAYTASLSSSVLDFPIEHGRRYHAFRGGSYVMPNDEQEIQRLDLTHLMVTKTIGDVLYRAPIDESKPLRILDVGTGTGIWAIEMGDLLPNAEILGNDLSPIQPAWLPPNVKFEVDDIESPWLHERPFDFIFCRYMTLCILDWPRMVGSIFNSLKPGGWAEFQDFNLQYYSEDGSLTKDHKTLIWINTLLDAANQMGREPSPGPRLEGFLQDAGFQRVQHYRFKIPIGPWAKDPHLKDIGMCNLAQILDGLEAFSLRIFCDFLKWSEEEVLVLLANVRKELKSGTIHAMFDYHVAYGQKP